MNTELWKQISGSPDYEVSNLGRVRRISTGRILSQRLRNKYKAVTLRSPVRRTESVHVLVLETFVGPRPEGLVACHGDQGSLDNRLTNLSWGTVSKNLGEDKHRDGTILIGESNPASKLTEKDVRYIRSNYEPGVNQFNRGNAKELAQRFDVDHSLIWMIATGKGWSHV